MLKQLKAIYFFNKMGNKLYECLNLCTVVFSSLSKEGLP